MAIKQAYTPIDIHTPKASAWPDAVPPMTPDEATRAARRLWRFAMGETFEGRIQVTSGNRYNWLRGCVLYVNPSKGWRGFVHDLSHLFVSRSNPSERPHSKFHARFEAKLVREVVRRGWLEGKLRTDAPEPPKPTTDDKRRHKLELVEAGIERWTRKLQRAERALAKLRKQQRHYTKVLGL